MKKTTLRQVALKLAFVAFVLLAPLGLRAQSPLTIGTGTSYSSTSDGLGSPMGRAYYYNSAAQFIYTAEELASMGGPKAITSVAFYHNAYSFTDDVRIYLAHTTSTTVDANNPATTATEVYYQTGITVGGSSEGWQTFTFDNPFNYNGTDNLLVIVCRTNSSGYSAYQAWQYTETTDNKFMVRHGDNTAYANISNTSYSYTASTKRPNIQIAYEEPSSCFKPQNLAATLTPGNGTIATLTWQRHASGTENAWVLEYGTASDFTGATSVNVTGGTPSKDLTGLTAETKYYARVKPDCDNDGTKWSNPINFTPSNALTVTVGDGTATSSNAPIKSGYGSQSEFVYPASMLTALEGLTLVRVKFYASTATASYTNNVTVYMQEVSGTTESTSAWLYDQSTATKVYEGTTLAVADGEMVITFSTPFEYNGGNLCFNIWAETNAPSVTWKGENPGYASCGYDWSITPPVSNPYSTAQFLPKATFEYEVNAYPKPKNLSVSGVTAHVANISWVAPSTEVDHYEYQYQPEGGSWTSLTSTTSTTAPLTGLAQNTTYTFQVKAVYSTGESQFASINFPTEIACPDPTDLTATSFTDDGATLGWTSTASNFNVRYRTAAVPNTLFFDDFENGLSQWTIYTDGEAPQSNGWLTIDPTSGLEIESHGDTYCASSFSWNNSAYDADNWLVTPQVPLTGTLKFWVRTNANWPDSYEVLLSTASNAEADFTEVLQAMAAAPNNGEWNEVVIDLSSYSGNGYIAIHHVDYDKNYLIIDDFGIYGDPTPAGAWTTTTASTNSLPVTGLYEQTTYDFEVQADCGGGEESDWVASTFTTLPSCMPVSTLAVDAATTTTIDLTWTDQNNGAATYVVTDNDDNAYTVTSLTTTGCTVTGLTANTAYTFKVKANCGDGFSSAEMVEGRTACDAITTLPYEESFEGDGLYCWTLDGFEKLTGYAHDGDASIYAEGSVTNPQYVVMPATDEEISGLMLNFWYSNYTTYNAGTLYVGYLTDASDYTTFTEVESIDMSTGIDAFAQTQDFLFTGAPAGSRIALKYEGAGINPTYILIDDVTIDNVAACMRPTDLAVTTPTAHGATFGWTSNGTETDWQLYISTSDVAPADDINVDELIPATTNPFVLTSGLNAETEHYVWVRANCGTDGYSTWVGPETFTTGIACHAPTGLTVDNITGHTADLSWTGTSTNYNIDYRTAEGVAPLLSEDFEDETSFNANWTVVNYSTSNTPGRNSNAGYNSSYGFRFSSYSNASTYEEHLINTTELTGLTNGVIEFYYKKTNSYAESFKVGYSSTDNDVASFTFGENHVATTSWQLFHEEIPAGTKYVSIQYTTTGCNYYIYIDDIVIGNVVAAGTWQHETSNDASKQLTGLNAETKYEVQVQGDCGSEGTSQWTASTFFITDIACMAPTTLAAGTPGPNEVDLTWTKTGTETAWQICLNGDETNLVEVAESDVTITGTTVAYTLEGLTAETPYTVKVRANCEVSNAGDGQSLWSNEVNFTTAASCPVPVLAAEGITNVSGHTADVAWTGFPQNDSYVVYYRMLEHISPVLSEYFEDETSFNNNWTVVNLSTANASRIGRNTDAHHVGNYGFRFSSYSNSSTYEEHLINTNELSLTNGVIEFYYKKSNTDAESFKVGYSSTNNDVSSFTFGENHEATQSWQLFHESIPAGTKYVSIQYTTTGCNYYLYIDDIVIGTPVPAGSLLDVPVTAPATSTTLTGLDPETPYEVYVTGHCATGDVTTVPSDIQTFTTTVACPAPVLADVDPATITTTTATLTWTGSAASNFTVAYKAAGETDFQEMDATASPFTFPNGTLNHSTVYTVKVKADCGGSDGESEWSNTKTFTTKCNVISALGYSENFDTYTAGNNVLPSCWSPINTTTNSTYAAFPRVYSTNPNSAPNCLYFYSYSYPSNLSYYDPKPQYAILPEMSDLAGKLVTLQARGDNTSSTYKIGTMSDPTDASTFTIIDEQALTTSYQEFEHIIPTDAQGNYLAIMMDAASGYNNTTRGVYIDDIQITEVPTCSKPTSPSVTANGYEATFTWVSDVYNYEVVYATSATANPDDLTPATTTDEEFTETMSDFGDYYFWVRANCGANGYSVWAGPASVHIGYCEPTLTSTTTSYYISRFTTTGGITNIDNSTTGAGHSYSDFYDNYSASAYPGLTVDFTITIAGGSTHGSAIWVDWNNDLTFSEDERVYHTTTYTSSPHNGSFTVPANTALGDHRMRIVSDYSGSNPSNPCSASTGEFEDYKLTVVEMPSCLNPTDLEMTENAPTSAKLSWTLVDNEQNAWVVEYATDENFATYETAEAATNVNYLLSPLAPSTTYYVRVKANCGDNGFSTASNVVTFTTLEACPKPTDVEALNITNSTATVSWNGQNDSYNFRYRVAAGLGTPIFSEDFSNGIGDWTMQNCHGSTGVSNGTFRFYYRSNPPQYLISPEITGINSDAIVEFTYWNHSTTYDETFQVGLSSTTNDVDAFSWSETITAEDQIHNTYHATVPAGTKYIAIKLLSDDQLYLYIDDIVIGEPVNAGEWVETSVNENHVDLSELTAETKYDAQVRGVCSSLSMNTEWTDALSFTTKAVFTKNVEANKWYAISSPMHNSGNDETLEGVNNLTGSSFSYDLYGYDEANGQWRKPDYLARAKGYIYRRSEATNLEFSGDANSGNFSASNISVSCPDLDLKGFALVGNPYNHTIYKGVAFGTTSYFITGWYKLTEEGLWLVQTNYDPINAGEAALVKVSSNSSVYNSFTDNANAPSAKSAHATTLAFSVSNDKYEDKAYAMFSDGEGLTKVGHLAADAPALSIAFDGRRYAIAQIGADAEAFEMNFRGSEGSYTIAADEAELSTFSYIHLIDRATGKDIDLLSNPTYSFTQNGSESVSSRFLVRLSPESSTDASASSFVYWNGSAWVVEGNGTLQVFDVLGRKVFSKEVNTEVTIPTSQFPGTGVYIIRLGEKSQKIVVK